MPTDDTDGSAPATCTFTADELDVPSLVLPEDPAAIGCSRPVWDGPDSDRCVWHAEQPDKPPDELAATVEDGTLLGAQARETDLREVPFPGEADLRAADLSGANLVDADLPGADLRAADLSGANLVDADLSGANLAGADLSGAGLGLADLSEAPLADADLSGANLYGANLSGANLAGADLSGADLERADLSGAELREADLTDVVFSRGTQLEQFKIDQVESRVRDAGNKHEGERIDSETWDGIARMYHALRVACSTNGLVGRARTFRVRERAARRKEAFVTGGRDYLSWFGSLLSRWLTGYGVRLRTVVGVMLGLYVLSTLIYLLFGIRTPAESVSPDVLFSEPFLPPTVVDTLYFSVVTFTTSPPGPVDVNISQWVAMVETFAGTALIVLLGYVLGNREQV